MASDLTNLLAGVFNGISVRQQGRQSLFELFGAEFDDAADVPGDVCRWEDGRFRFLGVLNALLVRARQERLVLITDFDETLWVGNLDEYDRQVAARQPAGRDSGTRLERGPESLRVDDRAEAADDGEASVFIDANSQAQVGGEASDEGEEKRVWHSIPSS